MVCSLKTGMYLSGSVNSEPSQAQILGLSSLAPFHGSLSLSSLSTSSKSKEFHSLSCNFLGQSLDVIPDQRTSGIPINSSKRFTFQAQAQAAYCISKGMRWWENTMKPNMVEINSAQELVDTLKNAGDRLVIVDFYSPGCGGCKSLHPKICQIAETNPDAIFLKVNYEELKPMCHALHIHVLPFFRFYRGPIGRLCSFSCTIATIKKFKDAMAKHGTERCHLGTAKGLDDAELLRLASLGQISIDSPLVMDKETNEKDLIIKNSEIINAPSVSSTKASQEENAVLVA